MPKQSWLADNGHRAFPLVDPDDAPMAGPHGPVLMPRSAILDAAFLIGPSIISVDPVCLSRVDRIGNTLRFTFAGRFDLAAFPLSFDRPVDAPEFATGRATLVAYPPLLSPCGKDTIWEGSLTTGQLGALATLLADGESLVATPGTLPLEAITAQRTLGTQVRSFSLASVARRVVTAPPGCPDLMPPAVLGGYVAAGVCLTGAIVLYPGHNCVITQNNRTNAITIAASPGAGDGPVCGEVPRYPGEPPAPGSSLLTGGPACNELVSSVNGVSAHVLRLTGGRGVSVMPHPTTPNTLVVAVDGSGLSTCL